MDFLKSIGLSVSHLRHPHYWVTSQAGIVLVVLAFSFSLFVLPWPSSMTTGWARLAVVVGFSLLVWFAWWGARFVYWKSGSGSKIGVAYEGYRVQWDDWSRTQRELRSLFDNGILNRRVKLKLLPMRLVENDTRCSRTESRYGFRMLIMANESPATKKGGDAILNFSIRGRFRSTDEQFIEAAARHAVFLFASSQSPTKCVLDRLRFRARGLFEMTLTMLAVIEYTNADHDRAAAIVELLETSVATRLQKHEYPRKAIRWLHAECLTAPCYFPGANPPTSDDLIHVRAKVQRAVDLYGDEFGFVHLRMGRTLFFFREIEDALGHTLRSLEMDNTDGSHSVSTLNAGVLYLFNDDYNNAHVFLNRVLDEYDLPRFGLDDLIGFADFAVDIGFPQAVLLQVLYRTAHGTPVPEPIRKAFDDWTGGASDRENLKYLVHKVSLHATGNGSYQASSSKKTQKRNPASKESRARRRNKRKKTKRSGRHKSRGGK